MHLVSSRLPRSRQRGRVELWPGHNRNPTVKYLAWHIDSSAAIRPNRFCMLEAIGLRPMPNGACSPAFAYISCDAVRCRCRFSSASCATRAATLPIQARCHTGSAARCRSGEEEAEDDGKPKSSKL